MNRRNFLKVFGTAAAIPAIGTGVDNAQTDEEPIIQTDAESLSTKTVDIYPCIPEPKTIGELVIAFSPVPTYSYRVSYEVSKSSDPEYGVEYRWEHNGRQYHIKSYIKHPDPNGKKLFRAFYSDGTAIFGVFDENMLLADFYAWVDRNEEYHDHVMQYITDPKRRHPSLMPKIYVE